MSAATETTTTVSHEKGTTLKLAKIVGLKSGPWIALTIMLQHVLVLPVQMAPLAHFLNLKISGQA